MRRSSAARFAAASRSRARRRSTWTTSDGREVRRGDVADDLVDRVDAVLAQAARVVADDRFARRLVDAVRADFAVVEHDDVAELPGDLGQLVLDDLTRTAADGRHLRLSDLEASNDHVA